MTNQPPEQSAWRKPALELRPDPPEGMLLRAIAEGDQQLLRQWKNLHRRSFFHQDIITPQMQGQWFAGYLTRAHDWMFMVVEGDQPAGCLGWRLWQGRADLYNVIRGEHARGGDGLMSRALCLLLSHLLAAGQEDIVARVIKGNPARTWYERNGFLVEQELEDHLLLRLDEKTFVRRAFRIIGGV